MRFTIQIIQAPVWFRLETHQGDFWNAGFLLFPPKEEALTNQIKKDT